MSYTKQFNLNIKDIETIEDALRTKISVLSENIDQNKKSIDAAYKLLGKLHQQKTWYRPKKDVYISG